MLNITRSATLLFLLLPLSAAYAQVEKPATGQSLTPTVTASASPDHVRFAAPSSVFQIHLEVYATNGERLFDNEVKGGNVLDWHLQNGQAERLPPGSYLCLVTVKTLSGKITQKLGSVAVEDSAAALQPVSATQLTAQQAHAIGPVEENSSLTILTHDEIQTPTVIAHNGEDGLISRGKGALSFRIGDFFSGQDTEQMRLTPEGNLGIGITKPAVRLDVDGMIRASQGITFPDGSIQYSAARKTLGAPSSRPTGTKQDAAAGQEHFEPQTSGTGTGGKLAKWTDNAGTLGDSAVTDTGHLTIDSSTNQQPAGNGSLIIQGNVNKERVELRSAGVTPGPALQGKGFGGTIASPTATLANTDLFIIGGSGHNGSGLVTFNAGTIKIKAEENWSSAANGSFINFETTPSGSPTTARGERMRITGSGSVGIGTAAPSYKLDVAGTMRAFSGSSNDIVVETSGGTNAWARMWMITPSQRWSMGTSQNFNGNQFYLVDDTFGQSRMTIQPAGGAITFPLGNVGIGTANPTLMSGGTGRMLEISNPASPGVALTNTAVGGNQYFLYSRTEGSSNTGSFRIFDATHGVDRFALDNSGNVGIGITNPTAKLQVNAVNSAAILANSQGNAVVGYSSAPGFAAIYGENTSNSAGSGVYGKSTGGYAMYADGNTGQALDKGGWVKAMLFVLADGTVSRCYNGVTGSSTGNCGFSVTTTSVNGVIFVYNIAAPFDLSNRFFSVTSTGIETQIATRILAVFDNYINITSFWTHTHISPDYAVPSDFFLIIY